MRPTLPPASPGRSPASQGQDWLEAHLIRLRAQLIVQESALAAARDDLAALQAAVPGLPARAALARQAQALQQRVSDLERACRSWQARAEREAGRADTLARALAAAAPPLPPTRLADALNAWCAPMWRALQGSHAGPRLSAQFPALVPLGAHRPR
ncbi:hypothetical protein [Eleftheria terrae]|uniref:hypothetical protein n=1 Tax=Eleftheria terrae TaxID=1597781 RepID=UPI00263BA3EE|nr:hypothetical protein [Eleftheria terrae]WKB51675.1 hypothetical protein N7L95_17995 [Eleftheria terrae]